jgi:hypothetical protein
MMSQASRTVAAWIFITGLLLIGFGVIIIALPEIFAALAALVFALVGLGCIGTGAKIFWTQRKLDRINRSDTNGYRKNVRIHTEEYYDL